MSKDHEPSRRFLGRFDAFKYGWLQYIKFIIALIIIIFVLFRFVIGFSYVSGNSMDTTLKAGELVVYSRIVPQFSAGNVVSVRMPTGEFYVKRVIGVPGDVIDMKDGRLIVNGHYMKESYTTGATEPQYGIVEYPYTVPEGDYFIMGDNREKSIDSRTFGSVSRRQVKGRLLLHFGNNVR